jgi:hypothetical protein
VTYDLYVLRVGPGESWQNALEKLARWATEPAWPPAELTHDDLRAWGRIVRRVGVEVGGVRDERFTTHAVLSMDAPRVRVTYSREHVSIQIPYWYSGAAALKALERGYTVARIVAEETGAVAVDPATGREIPSRVVAESA